MSTNVNQTAIPHARHRSRPPLRLVDPTPICIRKVAYDGNNPQAELDATIEAINHNRGLLRCSDDQLWEALGRFTSEFRGRLFEIGFVYERLLWREFAARLDPYKLVMLGTVLSRTLHFKKIADALADAQLKEGNHTRGRYKEDDWGILVFAGLSLAPSTIDKYLKLLVEEGWIRHMHAGWRGAVINAYALNLDWASLLTCLDYWRGQFDDDDSVWKRHRRRFIARAIRSGVSDELVFNTMVDHFGERIGAPRNASR